MSTINEVSITLPMIDKVVNINGCVNMSICTLYIYFSRVQARIASALG